MGRCQQRKGPERALGSFGLIWRGLRLALAHVYVSQSQSLVTDY